MEVKSPIKEFQILLFRKKAIAGYLSEDEKTKFPSLCFHRIRGWPKRYCRQQWPFQSPPDRANPQPFSGECFPGDIRQSPAASANNVTLRNSFKRYFFCPGLYGPAELKFND
ncbi:hypothetical protein CEXT_86111 [Caerostris extrusa]|uniref:Uncharacterized protein n=1 Tax=Caerostris extrusa TaxID=172846 RepID=A0AAV4SBK3_CAEEX|nr:hypothetical protein CEXT_86111 [Caerostris extrusa]